MIAVVLVLCKCFIYITAAWRSSLATASHDSLISGIGQYLLYSAIIPVIRETDEMARDTQTETCSYQTVITLGFLTFTTVNYLTKYLVPVQASQTVQQKWKWRNVATSFVHSLITGLWAPLCFYQVCLFVLR